MNESALILTHFHETSSSSTQNIDIQDFDIKKLFQQIVENKLQQTFILQTDDPKATLKEIKKAVRVINAAGGLVKNANSDYLFIKRLGKWDLPKGKVEEGEKMREAAVREVAEECSIEIDSLGKKIESTYHVYVLKGEFILKKTNWYKMKVNSVPDLIPQTEEDISDAKWFSAKDLHIIRENTYPLIKALIADLN
ncbi:NUDIX hydrolase [Albibacterium bauzanense]|uniref:ADP-ribose pyrophosphatase YjhB (NUDIX family) n=1 Tax=Albibacterium bauzanense TaxID=653929 RepID=A0A4V2PY97_9SPHI|nr:NUDIX domain-containing protein [Albibacterium bauzanense]TCK85161.1 ADP-ribose pyrophosphatase YjhB (NUDIX family) [Albibacterium bauzanense]